MPESEDIPSAEFLELFKKNEAEAFRELYRLHRHAVEVVVKNRLCKKTDPDFDDHVQEIFYAVMKAAKSFQGNSRVRTWIIQIARNTCARVIRDRARRAVDQLATDEAREPAEKGDSVPEKAEVGTLGPEAAAALAALPPEEVNAFLDHVVDGKSFAEIGVFRGIHENTARNRVERALATLRGLVVPLSKRSGDLEND